MAAQVGLAAADRQHVVVTRVDEATVRVWTQLPTCPAPASHRDWGWHTLDVALPPTVPAAAAVCSPTLRPGRDRVRVDLPWRVPHTPPPLRGHTRGIGADWGVNTLLTGTIADLDGDGRVVAQGRPVRLGVSGDLCNRVSEVELVPVYAGPHGRLHVDDNNAVGRHADAGHAGDSCQ